MNTMKAYKGTFLFDAVEFVSRVVSKDQMKEPIMHCYYDKEAEMMIGTDGGRMHTVSNVTLEVEESFMFDVLKAGRDRVLAPFVKDGMKYPGYKQVIPRYRDEFFWQTEKDKSFSKFLSVIMRDMDRDINIKWLLEYEDTGECNYQIFETSEKPDRMTPILLKQGNFEVIIMPLRVER